MNEQDIAKLFRQHAAQARGADDAALIDDVCAALRTHADPDRDDEPLDRVLALNEAAAIARIVAGLQPDITELADEVAMLRREDVLAAKPWRRRMRPVLALAAAASLFAVAVMVAGLNPTNLDPAAPSGVSHSASPAAGKVAPEYVISTVSFEADGVASAESLHSGRIFRGDFDS